MFRRRTREEDVLPIGGSIGAGVDAPASAAGEPSEGRANTNTNTNTHHHRSGIHLRTVRPGDATNYPRLRDAVRVHYEAFLKDTGEKFDSSRGRRRPLSFRVGEQQVIEGLEMAIQRMSNCQITEITIPHELAYGVSGYPPLIPPRSDLVFVVELIAIASSCS